MTDKRTFDREKEQLVPTRDFDHGVVHGKKGQALSDAEVADLSDDAIRRMTREGGVCEAKPREAAASAPADDGKGGKGGKGGDDDKGGAKP